jgi:hypothetical protein
MLKLTKRAGAWIVLQNGAPLADDGGSEVHLTLGSARRLARRIQAQTGEEVDPPLGDPADDDEEAIVIS